MCRLLFYRLCTPYNEVTLTVVGWDAPAVAPWLALAADRASERVFGKKCCYVGRGGSIPFMGMLGKMFPEAQFLITGVVCATVKSSIPGSLLMCS